MNGNLDMEEMEESNTIPTTNGEENVSEHTFGAGSGEKGRTNNTDNEVPINFGSWDEGAYNVESEEEEKDGFIPECEENMKPFIGKRFVTIEDGVQFYRQYAALVGFDVRCSTVRKTRDGDISVKYLLCSREGHTNTNNDGIKSIREDSASNTNRRRRVSNRVGCMARCGLRRQKEGDYAVSVFKEEHNHRLCSKQGKTFLKINRNLGIGHQAFIAACAKANIGTSKAFEIYKELAGGFENIGATCVDFRNCRRDVHAHLHEADAQAVIDKYTQKQEMFPTYTFDYDVDDENQLCRVFWADPIAKRNFKQFGEMMSFDATYRTNRYRLVFVPFTGIDNHKKCVTFGAGLIAKEDIQSYVWLLSAFKRCMVQTPTCVITDQDPAMKEAVPQVFPETRHRFCMWHIMSKVGEKVGVTLAKNEIFRKELNAVVWDPTLGRDDFENRWHAIMSEYGLVEHRWFTQLFDVRDKWVEAYFEGVFMGGLMRTTSRSEAENGVFGSCINDNGSLLEFFTQFESVIEMQRHKQGRLSAETEGSRPKTKTPLLIEKHAATIYTITMFYDVQAEIYEGCFSCRITCKEKEEDKTVYTVKEGQRKTYTVTYSIERDEIECSCGKFNRVGILCRHVFLVLKDNDAEMIPPRYIIPRWTKNATASKPIEIPTVHGATTNRDAEENALVGKLWNEFNNYMALCKGKKTAMHEMINLMQEHNGKLLQINGTTQSKRTTAELVETFYGTQPTTEITVKPPPISKNKGSGKRLRSAREKEVEKKKKEGRKCHFCEQQPAQHDSRNCPLNPNKKKKT